MKKKQRNKLRAKRARTQNKGYAPCTHYDAYMCSRCVACYACDHDVIGAPTIQLAIDTGSELWWRCPDGFAKPSYMDIGQFSNLKNKFPEKQDWEWYAR